MIVDKEQELGNLTHIRSVLEERTIWYKKRQLETKRAMKAMHRLNTLPEPIETQTMLEAEISYAINKTGIEALTIIINQFDELNTSITKSHLRREFIKQLQEADELFAKEQLSEIQYSALFDVVFSLDENYQRTIIANFILDFGKQLIIKIFKNIVILDETYTVEVIDGLIKHMQKNTSC
ncbi:MAG: hypothetical protein KAJ76_03975 [Candidatus Heimdallarchaeota archaeon]|nr:hypothetical protein [Candidatus Heimdallarchaeota archaeon]MCK5298040.1 hypothetical protein [Candidatus Heimdallarchaeota archaeon]